MRIAICTNFVSPYRRPVFESIADQTGATVGVFTSTAMEGDRLWDAASSSNIEILQSKTITRSRTLWSDGGGGFKQRLERHYPVSLPIDLARFRPHVILSGELGPRTILAMLSAEILRVPFIPWTYHARAQADTLYRSAWLRRPIINRASAVIGMGTQAREVLLSMGCPEPKVFDAPNAGDSESISRRRSSPEHGVAVEKIRDRFSGKKIAVVVGRLVPMKGIDRLLAAWDSMPPDLRDRWALAVVGDGPLRHLVEGREAQGVHAIGHIAPEFLPDWFVAADLHIFASLGDPWGLVVNESMQCGTPTLCSTLAGCADDLITDHRNGTLFDPGLDTPELAAALERALSRDDLEDLGSQAERDIRSFTPATMARGMVAAVEHAVSGPASDLNGAAA